MAALPYMQFYPGDYLKDTTHLTTVEHGAYMLLIMNYWNSTGVLPANYERLAKITKLSIEEFEKIKPTLLEFFEEKDGFWIHHRIDSDLLESASKSEKARESVLKRHYGRNTGVLPTSYSSDIRCQISDNKKINKKDFKDIEEIKISDVFDHWIKIDPERHSAILDIQRRKSIKSMLKYFSADDLKKAIDGCKVSPFHNGKETGKIWDNIEMIFKSVSQVEKFIQFAKNPPSPNPIDSENRSNKYEEFLNESKCENSKKFVEILKRAEAECRYDLTIEEVRMYHKSLKSFSLGVISGAFDDFQAHRTPYDGKFPKVKLLLDFVHQRETIMKGVAEQSWNTVIHWINKGWDISTMNPSKIRTIIIDDKELRKQLPENLSTFRYDERAKEKFIELFLKIEEVEK